jgi:pimeloyl-ACP methyl ester carboxylesterase
VCAPTLTGLGRRAGELAPTIDLRTHVEDVVGVLDAAADPVVLVGHSYAGFVVREAADRRPERVAGLVLLDAWFGADGESLFDRAPAWFADAMRDVAGRDGDGWRIPPPDPSLVGVDDPTDAGWLRARLTDQPLATFEQPTTLTGAVDAAATTAIATSRALFPFAEWSAAAGWPVTLIDAGHDAMVTTPVPLADLLLDAARPVARR